MYEESALPDMRRVVAKKTGYADWTIYIMDYSLSCYIFLYKGRYLFCFVTDLWLQRYWRWLWSPAPHWADRTKAIWRNRTILIVSCICGETELWTLCYSCTLKCVTQRYRASQTMYWVATHAWFGGKQQQQATTTTTKEKIHRV